MYKPYERFWDLKNLLNQTVDGSSPFEPTSNFLLRGLNEKNIELTRKDLR